MKFAHRKFLITGGAGFIGSAVAKILYNKSADLTILDDFSTGNKSNLIPGCNVIEGNIADRNWMNKIPDIDYILHFAAPSSVILFRKSPGKCLTETIIGTVNVFEYAKRFGVKKVIIASSSSVYGNTPLPQSENTPVIPTNLYGVAKLTCEHIARLYSEYVPSVCLRIFAGYGPGEEHKGEFASIITLFMNAIAKNSEPVIFGDGSQSRDFVYIDDITEAVLRSIEAGFTGIINVGSGKSYTFNEVLNLISRLLGKNVHARYVEKPTQYFEHTLADITLMKNVLGICPLTLEDGLKKYLEVKGVI